MLYAILSILTLIGGLGTWLYRLLLENKGLKQQAAIDENNQRIKEWSNKIVGIEKRIEESERDYEEKKAKFHRDHPDDGGAA